MNIQNENPTVRSVREKDFLKEYGMTLARKDEIFSMRPTVEALNAMSDKERLFRFAYSEEYLSRYPVVSRREEHEIKKIWHKKNLEYKAAGKKAEVLLAFCQARIRR